MRTRDTGVATTAQALQGIRKDPVGPVLSLAFNGDLVLTENSKSRVVRPEYRDGSLRIGCTMITRDALVRILAFIDVSANRA